MHVTVVRSNNMARKGLCSRAMKAGLVLATLLTGSAHAFDWAASNHDLKIMDVDGDGLFDIYLQPKAQTQSAELAYDINLDVSLLPAVQHTSLLSSNNHWNLQYKPGAPAGTPTNLTLNRVFGDFNGDGYQDVAILPAAASANGAIVAGFPTGGKPYIISEISGDFVDGSSNSVTASDVNGDGLADLINDNGTSPDSVALSLKNGGLTATVKHPLCQAGGQQDVDCDSVPDIIDSSPYQAPANSSVNHNLLTASTSIPETIGTKLAGLFSVTQDGKASYQIPLTTVPSIASVTPGLALNYNQAAGNGLVGVGWNISGLSEITRCGTTLATDDFINGVNYNGVDQYCINGQRLIKIATNEYRLENETFSKITTSGTKGSGPLTFTVKHAEGMIETYGGSTSSRRLSDDSAHVHTWALSKVEDREGNYATYNYINTGQQFWIDSIQYGGNSTASQSADREVKFEYQARDDKTKTYNAVTEFVDKRLYKVVMKLGTTTVRYYELGYTAGETGRSLLETVKECAASAICKPATVFTWHKGSADESELAFTSTASESGIVASQYHNQQYHVGDVNRDGRADLIWTYRNNNTLHRQLYLANGTGFNAPIKESDESFIALAIPDNQQRYLVGDVNGDGRADLIWLAHINDTQVRNIYLANASGNGFTSQGYELDVNDAYNQYLNGEYQLADVNGDGLQDIVWTYTHDSKLGINTYLAKYNNGQVSHDLVSIKTESDYSPIYYQNHRYATADVNGDGKDDLIWTFDYQNKNYRALFLAQPNGGGFTKISLQSEAFTGAKENVQTHLGDVNGDGRADYVQTFTQDNRLKVIVRLASVKGTSFTGGKSETYSIDTALHREIKTRLVNINNDGRIDLVYNYTDDNTIGGQVHLANINGIEFDLSETIGSRSKTAGSTNHGYLFADITRDGKADRIFTYNTSSTLERLVWTQAQSYPDRIDYITDGLGVKVDPEYAYLAGSSFYTPSQTASYPYRDDTGNSFVVKRVSRDNGIGGTNFFDYHYQGAKTHLRGRGFVGFEKRTEVNNTRGTSVVDTYHQAFPLIGELKSSLVKNGTVTIQETHNDWSSVSVNSNKNTYRYLNRQAVVKRNPGVGNEITAAVTTNNFNTTYGYLDDKTTVTGRGYSDFSIATPQQTVVVDYSYNINAANWRIRFVSNETQTFSQTGKTTRVLTRAYTPYSTSSLLPLTETEYQGSDVELTRTYVRDAFGNVTKVTVTGKDIDGGTMQAQVDTVDTHIDGVYPNISTNAENHTEQRTFDLATGAPQKLIDANGLPSYKAYDVFGNLRKEIRPDGTQITYIYGRNSSYGAAYYVVRIPQHPNQPDQLAEPVVSQYFDAYQRLIAELTMLPDESVVQFTRYDALGRVVGVSIPLADTATDAGGKETVTTYDVMDRVLSETRPDGGKAVINYQSDTTYANKIKTTTTVKIPGAADQTLTEYVYHNALGQMRKSTDANTTHTVFEYDTQGNLDTVTVDGNAATKVTVKTNIAGMRTELDDPDAGLITFEYDAAGRERRRTYGSGAESQTTVTSYDRLGRMLARTDTAGSTSETNNWTWDRAGALGLPRAETGPRYSHSYFYDKLTRLKYETIAINESIAKRFDYGYDDFSRLAYRKFPSGVALTYHYHDRGARNAIRDAVTQRTYWQANKWNKYGNVVDAEYGNGAKSLWEFDELSGRIETIDTTKGSTVFQNLTYVHDSAGNLRSRQAGSLKETFTYDSLHRLNTAITTGLSGSNRTLSYTYDDLGNITTKSDVANGATYAYGGNGAGPHAVTNIPGHGSYGYDFKGNMIMRPGFITPMAYTVFNKPSALDKGSDYSLRFYYAPNRKRILQTRYDASVAGFEQVNTKYYTGDYEEVEVNYETTRKKAYVDDFLVITRVTNVNQPESFSEDFDYLHRDHLGSVEATTDRFGNSTGRFAFDAWGQRRQDSWQSGSPSQAELAKRTFDTTTRGFTGHEHIDSLGFIHMGGRTYDPVIGRFMSPDDYVQYPHSSQSYNRYSYVLNNPLSYTDPSGEIIFAVVWAAIKIVDAGMTAYDTYQLLADSNLSNEEKAKQIAISMAMAVIPVPKVVTKSAGKLYDRVKSNPITGNKSVSAKKPEKGSGPDANTQKPPENQSPCGCFAPGTPVETEAGLKPIETVQVGDRVAAMDELTQDISWKAIEKVYHYQGREYFTLTLASFDTFVELTVTDDHPVWVVGKGWLRTIELQPNDQLITREGEVLDVIGWQSQGRYGETFNFEVEDYHTYFVGEQGVWVHNGPCARKEAKLAAAEQRRLKEKGEISKLPAATSAVVDSKTGKVYTATSGQSISGPIPAPLKKRMPKESLEDWGVANCAEFVACALALKDGADFNDLIAHTVKTKSGSAFPRCQNCQLTTSPLKRVTSDE